MDDIRKCTKTLNKSNVEQTAYFRVWGAKNNIEMDKYHEQVQKEIKLERQKEDKEGINFIFGWPPTNRLFYCINSHTEFNISD